MPQSRSLKMKEICFSPSWGRGSPRWRSWHLEKAFLVHHYMVEGKRGKICPSTFRPIKRP